jgi:hypothetical protein
LKAAGNTAEANTLKDEALASNSIAFGDILARAKAKTL